MRTLYHWPLDPFSRTVRLALGEKKLPAELVETPFWGQPEPLAQLAPGSCLPVLVEAGPEGRVVTADARACLEYLEDTHPSPALMPLSARGRAEVRRLCAAFERGFDQEVNTFLLYERLSARVLNAGPVDPDRLRLGARALTVWLTRIGDLAEARGFLAGGQLSFADLVAAAHVSCLDFFGDIDWAKAERARSWYVRIKSRPAFRALLKDRVKGIMPPAHYADLDF